MSEKPYKLGQWFWGRLPELPDDSAIIFGGHGRDARDLDALMFYGQLSHGLLGVGIMPEEIVGHLTIGLTQRECEVLAELSERMDLPQDRIMVLALRLYQAACDGHEAPSKMAILQTDIVEAINTWLIVRDAGSYSGRLLLAARNEIEQLRKQANLQTWTGGDGKPPGITMRISE